MSGVVGEDGILTATNISPGFNRRRPGQPVLHNGWILWCILNLV